MRTYRDFDKWLVAQANEKIRNSPMNMAGSTALQNPVRHAAQFLGRDQGTELFFSSNWQEAAGALNVQLVPKALNINRPLNGILIRVGFTDTLSTAGYTTWNPEAPQNILQNIRITGTHAKFGALVPVNISGATAWMRGQLRREVSSSMYLTPTAGGIPGTRMRMGYYDGANAGAIATGIVGVANGGGPLCPLLSPASLLGSAIGDTPVTYDIFYFVDMAPMLGPWSRMGKLPFSWRPEDWGDSLQIQLTFGNRNALGTNAADANTIFSNMTYSIFNVYDILGQDYVSKVSPAVLILNEQNIPALAGGPLNNQRLALLQKQKTTQILLKTGVQATYARVGPNFAYFSMDDITFEQTVAAADNKPIHNNLSNMSYRDHLSKQYGRTWPQGYFALDFLGSQNPLTYYRGDLLSGSATFEMLTNTTQAVPANTAIQMLQEQVIGEPALG